MLSGDVLGLNNLSSVVHSNIPTDTYLESQIYNTAVLV